MVHEFDLVIQRVPGLDGAFVVLPLEGGHELANAALGRVAVFCEFDDVPARGTLVALNGLYLLGVSRLVRKRIGKNGGSTVHVRLWRDETVPIIELPAELSDYLENNAAARAAYQRMNIAARAAMLVPIHAAFNPEMRARRIEAAKTALEHAEGEH